VRSLLVVNMDLAPTGGCDVRGVWGAVDAGFFRGAADDAPLEAGGETADPLCVAPSPGTGGRRPSGST
jgi:hypothetical protein